MTVYAEVRAKIDPGIKMRATDALDEMELSISDVVRILVMQIADEQRLPTDLMVPNAKTQEAMRELEEGRGERFECASAGVLFRRLGT